jgi:hypothetical protein
VFGLQAVARHQRAAYGGLPQQLFVPSQAQEVGAGPDAGAAGIDLAAQLERKAACTPGGLQRHVGMGSRCRGRQGQAAIELGR